MQLSSWLAGAGVFLLGIALSFLLPTVNVVPYLVAAVVSKNAHAPDLLPMVGGVIVQWLVLAYLAARIHWRVLRRSDQHDA